MKKIPKHPSKDIKASTGNILSGKTICVCLTGSVSVVNSPALCRGLMRQGAEVYVVMTPAATKLIHPDLLHWATGNEVITELTGAIEHIALAGERPNKKGSADLIIVAPATANTISKIACGIDDTPVTTVVTTAFGSGTPIIIAPAMHESMFRHPILEQNILRLQKYGVEMLMPRVVERKAKIAETEEIIDFIIDKLVVDKDLLGLKFLITAGPGREYIDRVRYISNPSSGRMGMEIASEIIMRGGRVTIISGTGTAIPPLSANVLPVVSANDFLNAIHDQLSKNKFNVFISAAAISDFTPIKKREEKVSSSNEKIGLELKATPKIIDAARKADNDLFIVAFKAETNLNKEELVEKAYNRLKKA
ncbi:MAG: bifunctional phosphopantothenoylcysteine decarboxylase/phosphopantothenate--cysteine ligase CoaBC, partial [archaeon]|nr:bifunctional phosphopantothenoylcysteine decarboxylase/phosphopantothenate--cysteine ligase CoaBC [archaeon]